MAKKTPSNIELALARYSGPTNTLLAAKREYRDMVKYLKYLCEQCKVVIDALDDEMKKPSDFERGKRIAKILNHLDSAYQHAELFGLPYSMRKKVRSK